MAWETIIRAIYATFIIHVSASPLSALYSVSAACRHLIFWQAKQQRGLMIIDDRLLSCTVAEPEVATWSMEEKVEITIGFKLGWMHDHSVGNILRSTKDSHLGVCFANFAQAEWENCRWKHSYSVPVAL